MNITLFANSDASKFERRMKALGFTLSTEPFDVTPEWSGDRFSASWLQAFTGYFYREHAETEDVLLFLADQWEGRDNNLGFHLAFPHNGYRIGVTRRRRGWEDTAEHELLHAADWIIRTYLGMRLEGIFDVTDFAEDVVHGRDPRFNEYRYDEVWKTLSPYLNTAIAKRKRMAYLSWRDRLMVRLRETIQQLMAQQETITVPEEMAHPIPKAYRKAISQRFLNPNGDYRSGMHNGTDWSLPEGTPISAPADGAVTRVYEGGETGYGCDFRFAWRGEAYAMRLLHLKQRPAEGTWRRGDVIGISGNTGMSSGPHCHIDLWQGGEVDVSRILTPQGVINNLIDPEAFFTDAV